MKILVTVKTVPDPDLKIRVNGDGTGIEKDGIKYVVNPFDEIAVEEALRIKADKGGDVVVLGIGGSDVPTQIRQALAMGADSGIHVQTDEVLDSNLVARIIEAVYKKDSYDIIFMGKQATDDDANQAAQLAAEYLGIGQATFAAKVEMEDGAATVTREADGGMDVVKVKLPAVITADLRLNEPRYATLPGIMKAKRKPMENLSPADLGVAMERLVTIESLEAPPERAAGVIVKSVDELVEKLVNEAKII